MRRMLIFCAALFFLFPLSLEAGTVPDPELVSAIAVIKVIDNHAHPLRMLREGERDREWGDLSYHASGAADPAEGMALTPFRLRPKSPEYPAVWRALFGVPEGAITRDSMHGLYLTKRRIMAEQAGNYPSWILDRIGTETMLANRVVMDPSLPHPRFRWVPYADVWMYPLDNAEALKRRPDLASSYDALNRLMRTHLVDLGLRRLPSSLKGYLAEVVTPALERQKQKGAVAVKFQTAYIRPLDIGNPPEAQAGRVYERYVREGTPAAGEYKALQDYLFRFIAREAGRLGMAVHIHTGLGIGHYFDVAGSHPLLLEPLFNDPALRKTSFVIIHGGWPFAGQTAAMLLKPNVYADFSAIAFLIYPHELSDVLRSWLEVSPDKVLFGTDGFEVDPNMLIVNWEEFACLGTVSARQALAVTLTEMMNDREISREEAMVIARQVLRENAVKLYKLDAP